MRKGIGQIVRERMMAEGKVVTVSEKGTRHINNKIGESFARIREKFLSGEIAPGVYVRYIKGDCKYS
jgi:hypothetical protein